MKIRMTYDLAMAAARDAGDRHMCEADRTKWNQADYNAMVREFNRLWPSGTNTVVEEQSSIDLKPTGRLASEYGNDEIRWPDGLQHY